jgi:glycerophosphoryl diester phosphodiesterase
MLKQARNRFALILFSLLLVSLVMLISRYPVQLVVQEKPLVPIETKRPNMMPFTIGHRGAALHAPENTLAAIDKAIALGFDYVELDVRYTSDDVPVLLHDSAVDRTTNGSGQIFNMSYADLQKLDAGSWYSEEFAGEQVPSLEDALKLMQGKVCALWHAKSIPRKSAVNLFHKYNFTDGCIVVALSWGLPELFETEVSALNKLWLNPPLSLGIKQLSSLPGLLEEYPGAKFLHIRASNALPELVDAVHASGRLIYTRTVYNQDNAKVYKWLLDSGVDGLMLGDIEGLRQFLIEDSQPDSKSNPQ